MVDAAVGSKAVLGRGISKGAALGSPQGVLKFLNFISAEFSRDSKENLSTSITGSGAQDKGTPGTVAFTGKLKYDLTVDRVLMDLVGQYGAPTSITALQRVTSVTVGGSGTGYTGPVVFTGGGAGAVLPTAHATIVSGNVTAIVMDTPGSGITAAVTVSVTGGTGQTFTAVLATDAWLVKIRPGATISPSNQRAIWTYLDEGGSYSPSLQFTRRPSDIALTDNANKRVEVEVTYAEPTGDTITGFPLPAIANSGTIDAKQLGTRGRRAYDADFTAGNSVYLKVISSTATTAVVKAVIAAASPGDGTGFPTPTFGAITFTIYRPNSAQAPDGYVTVIDSTSGLPYGLYGENNEPFEVTFGDQSLSTLVANDLIELPVAMIAGGITKTVVAENRLSEFHLVRNIDGAKANFDSGSVKWGRPFKAYYVNARRLPLSVDPTGYITASVSFKKRLFDRAFRVKQEAFTRFTVEDLYRFNTPIVGSIYEGIHAFYPVMAVATMKSGDVSTKELLEETITLENEQPDAAPTPPAPLLAPQATFDASAVYAFQINLVTRNDPTFLA